MSSDSLPNEGEKQGHGANPTPAPEGVSGEAVVPIDSEDRAERGHGGGSASAQNAAAWITASMLAVLPLVVAIIVAAFVLSTTAQHRVDRNHAILAAARQEVSELIRLGPTSSQASYDRLLAGSTGSWRDQLARQSDAFTKLAKGNNIQVQGSINAAALQFANDDRARVLIVANSVVKAPSDPSGSTVPYRIAETLELHGDTWLVSELEFVA